MRTLKLRAWDEEGKQMINHNDLTMNCDGFFAIDEHGTEFPQTIIMQATGLLDKNGKEIYEGDIVKWDDEGGSGCITYFCETTEYIVDTWKEGEKKSKGYSLSALGELEVIVNVYEYSHLLKKLCPLKSNA